MNASQCLAMSEVESDDIDENYEEDYDEDYDDGDGGFNDSAEDSDDHEAGARAGSVGSSGGASSVQARKGTSSASTFWGTYEPTRVFESVFAGLTGTDDEAKGLRKKAWRDADASGNGHASLAEVRTAARTRTR